MTRLVRTTFWPPPGNPPVTMAVLEDDLKVSAEELVESWLVESEGRPGFVTYEFVETTETDIVVAVEEAIRGAEEKREDEQNMALAYYWYLGALAGASPTGTVLSTLPAPLTRDQLAWVFRSIAHCKAYESQSIVVPLRDGTTIKMVNGEVMPA